MKSIDSQVYGETGVVGATPVQGAGRQQAEEQRADLWTDLDDATLTRAEQSQLAILEDTIERGLKTFIDVGTALIVVRDSRLYRQDYGTFEDYCQQRWKMQRRYAYRLMEAAEVVQNVSNWTQTLPATESQARPLTSLEPEQQREAWATAVATAPNGKVTAAHVQRVADEYHRPEPMAVHYSSDRHDWETPPELFRLIDAEFHFTLDVCAQPHSAKCACYFTPEHDGLVQDWRGHICWMNPPYGEEIGQWMAKARREGQNTTVVCLIPARVDTGWWWDSVITGEIRFLKGRVKFLQPDMQATGAPFPSAVVVFGPGVEPKTVWWDWKDDLQLRDSTN